MSTGVIILAAGNSSRLGRPKQLVEYQGVSLLQQTLTKALHLKCGPVVVVEGAYSFELPAEDGLTTVQNAHWQKGMGSSIKTGLNELETDASVRQVLILLSDQPLIPIDHLKAMLAKKEQTPYPMIATFYKNSYGVPALFDRACFPDLHQLEDGQGAKQLFQANPDAIGGVPLDAARIDIDTPADVQALNQSNWKHFD
ncbi:NTP transferase domain-containing protein [Cyclobacterium xiamenense]|uniref:nucleotidyltransferase family protein n=1 Tax=Cyclobacterium xiamenense TaxID=1297121 RepID=UPI0035D0B775